MPEPERSIEELVEDLESEVRLFMASPLSADALRHARAALLRAVARLREDAARWSVVRNNWFAADLTEGTVSFWLPGLSAGVVRVGADPDAAVDASRAYLAALTPKGGGVSSNTLDLGQGRKP